MLIQDITKEKVPVKQSKRLMVPTFSYHVVEGVSEAEIQRRLDHAFDILFTEVFKNNKGVDKSF